jgi:hypothetical protein
MKNSGGKRELSVSYFVFDWSKHCKEGDCMLICKNCGAKLADHSKKCYACGSPVTPETVIYKDPFAEDETSRESVQNAAQSGREGGQANPFSDASTNKENRRTAGNIWEERYGKDAENRKDPVADYDWQDEADIQGLLKRLQNGEKGLTDEELLIGPGAFGYEEKFKKMREKNSLINWNWGAFLLGPIWFGYRKMYAMALVTMAMAGFFGILFQYQLAMIVSVILDVAMGLFGDRIYLEHIARLERKIGKVSQDKKPAFIRRHGGVAVGFVMILFLIYWIASMALTR